MPTSKEEAVNAMQNVSRRFFAKAAVAQRIAQKEAMEKAKSPQEPVDLEQITLQL
jgi:hypothetical protein